MSRVFAWKREPCPACQQPIAVSPVSGVMRRHHRPATYDELRSGSWAWVICEGAQGYAEIRYSLTEEGRTVLEEARK